DGVRRTGTSAPQKHGFGYSSINLLTSYNPPDVLGANATTGDVSWTPRLDRLLGSMMHADLGEVQYGYDAGRLSSVALPFGGSVSYARDPVTGRLSSASDPSTVTLTFGYDGSLETDVAWSGDVAGTLHRVFDNDFRV